MFPLFFFSSSNSQWKGLGKTPLKKKAEIVVREGEEIEGKHKVLPLERAKTAESGW